MTNNALAAIRNGFTVSAGHTRRTFASPNHAHRRNRDLGGRFIQSRRWATPTTRPGHTKVGALLGSAIAAEAGPRLLGLPVQTGVEDTHGGRDGAAASEAASHWDA